MEYSPIKTFRVKNFRNIGDVTIDFTESPIVVFRGDNESGKTSIIKGFAVLSMHAFSRYQNDFIRNGTNGFGLALQLQDNTLITRIKNNAANIYSIKYPDGTEWNTNKIDAGGVPIKVQEVMGLIEEPETKEYLHIRTYEDSLLFVVTPASVNYKVMYNALKVDQLTQAIKLGSTRANELKANIDDTQNSIKTLMEELRKIRLYDIDPVINIKNRIKKEITQVELLSSAFEKLNRTEQIKKELGLLNNIQKHGIQQIDIGEVTQLAYINRNLIKLGLLNKNIKMYLPLETVKPIDMHIIEKLRNTLQKINRLQELNEKVKIYKSVDTIKEIDIGTVLRLQSALNKVKSVTNIKNQLSKLNLSGAMPIEQSEVATISKIGNAISMAYKLRGLSAQLNKLSTNDVTQVSEQEIQSIVKLQRAIELRKSIGNLNSQLFELNTERNTLISQIKESGAVVADCPRCGESVIVDARAYV